MTSVIVDEEVLYGFSGRDRALTGGPYVLAERPDAREGKDGVVASDVPLELDGRGRRCISMVHVMCSIK